MAPLWFQRRYLLLATPPTANAQFYDYDATVSWGGTGPQGGPPTKSSANYINVYTVEVGSLVSNHFDIFKGASATIQSLRIGDAGGHGIVNVGADNPLFPLQATPAQLTIGLPTTGVLTVGYTARGEFNLSNGAIVAAINGSTIGSNAGSDGTLSIASGGKFTASQNFIVGNQGNSSGAVTVSGENSELKTTTHTQGVFRFALGNLGKGSLTVEDRATVEIAGSITIGNQDGGDGTLSVRSGGKFTASQGFTVGNLVNSTGAVTVSGENSELKTTTNGIFFNLGDAGKGSLTVEDRATVEVAGSTVIGNQDGGDGTLSIASGGKFTGNQGFYVGYATNSIGAVTVSGENSELKATNIGLGIFLGDAGKGSLTVEEGATVEMAGTTVIGRASGGDGTLSIASGSKFTGNSGFYVGWATNSIGAVTVSGVGSELKQPTAV